MKTFRVYYRKQGEQLTCLIRAHSLEQAIYVLNGFGLEYSLIEYY